MSGPDLDSAFRTVSGRVIAALAARYRDIDLAEEAFAEACAQAAETWPRGGTPADPAAWLYRTADRRAIDALRRHRTRSRLVPEAPPAEPTAEDILVENEAQIPDERLRLIFVCCHPAVAADTRAALTLRLVCGLTTAEIARAFLVSEATLAQRLVRAKRKIADAGVPYEIPEPQAWPERLEAVLSTLEIAYAKAHEDAAGDGPHADYAREILQLTAVLTELLPHEPEALALAATVRYAEARRPARTDANGVMIPLSEQDPKLWRRELIEAAETYLMQAAVKDGISPRSLEAAIHSAWCARRTLAEPAPWPLVLSLYDVLLTVSDNAVVRLNRVVALAEVHGAELALSEIDRLDGGAVAAFPPYHAVRAEMLRRTGRIEQARIAYQTVLALSPPSAERRWLQQRLAALAG